MAAKHGDDGGIVANNPSDPTAAGMTVTDAKLINLPEKTKFDVVGQVDLIDPPPPPSGGSYARSLAILNSEGFSLIDPSMESLVEADMTWNRVTPEFKILVQSPGQPDQIYDNPDEIPGLTQTKIDSLALVVELTQRHWISELELLQPQQLDVQSIFQLDPNQLLTVSNGFKVVLRRPL